MISIVMYINPSGFRDYPVVVYQTTEEAEAYIQSQEDPGCYGIIETEFGEEMD